MENTAPIFDTHTDIQELMQSGMPEPQAETVVRQRVRLLEHNFATKADIEKLRQATKADIEKLRQATKADIAETNANIERLRLETKANIADINTHIATSKNEMIKWFIGVILTIAALIITVIIAAITGFS